MARDRKRAKARRDQRARQGGPAGGRPPRPPRPAARADDGARDEPDAPLEPVEDEQPQDAAELVDDELDFDFGSDRGTEEAAEEPVVDVPVAPGVVPVAPGIELAENEIEHEAPVRAERGSLPARAAAFLQGCWRELQRVQWPDRRQVLQATAVVIGFVVVAGLYLGVLDVLWQKVVDVII